MERILVPLDESPMSERALKQALRDYPDAEIHLFHAIDLSEVGYSDNPDVGVAAHAEEWERSGKERAETLFDRAEETVAEVGFRGDVVTSTELGSPARTIVSYAEDHDIDHIVMGSHGRSGISRVLLGSVAESVVRRSPCPVSVVR